MTRVYFPARGDCKSDWLWEPLPSDAPRSMTMTVSELDATPRWSGLYDAEGHQLMVRIERQVGFVTLKERE
jgi:hypothetical protein